MKKQEILLVLLPSEGIIISFMGLWYVTAIQKYLQDGTLVTMSNISACGALLFVYLTLAYRFNTAQLNRTVLASIVAISRLLSYIVLYFIADLDIDTIMTIIIAKSSLTEPFLESFRDRIITSNIPGKDERDIFNYTSRLVTRVSNVVGGLLYSLFVLYSPPTPENKLTILVVTWILYDLDTCAIYILLWFKKLDLE
jgi:hypothetical protein